MSLAVRAIMVSKRHSLLHLITRGKKRPDEIRSREITSLMNLFPMRRDIRAGRGNYFMPASSTIGLDSGIIRRLFGLGAVREKEKDRESNLQITASSARDEILHTRDELKTPDVRNPFTCPC